MQLPVQSFEIVGRRHQLCQAFDGSIAGGGGGELARG